MRVQGPETSPDRKSQEIPTSTDPITFTAEQILEHQRAFQEASFEFQTTNPDAAFLYARYMEAHYDAQPHERNAVIVEAVPFLYRAISETHILDLLRHFWRCHHPLFRATEREHMAEVTAMLDAVRNTFLNELPPAERQLYLNEEQRVQTTYRICRDLAALGKVAPGVFFLSASDLAIRLGVDSQQAYRALQRLRTLGILRIEKPGEPRAKGVSGVATTYRWTLPLPEPTTPAAEPAPAH
ncbi:MAG: hypothetical protein JNL10_03990 [Verrucomicrobiales bacterium]|nr:hypothetical protein [Verrucomicrobiales bacterium]